jgi:hypothetical protein
MTPVPTVKAVSAWTVFIVLLLQMVFVWPAASQGEQSQEAAPFRNWPHSGSIFLLTTPDGADLPPSAVVENFPVLVRLSKEAFDFGQSTADGSDIRFSSATGAPLAYHIEEWDVARGTASIWVRVPKINGNARQELKMYWWGVANANGGPGRGPVFDQANGYVSVFHMNGTVKDQTGSLGPTDTGTTEAPGIIGPARRFAQGRGISCGDKITTLPTGSTPSTTQAWFRADTRNAHLLGWGNEEGQGKVVMQYRSPAHIRMDCYFSGASVESKSTLRASEWVHVVHTYQKGESRLYINGVLDGESKTDDAPLNIKRPARMWIGGWYDNYDFVGDIDEVRISNVARSADWVKLEYENQKPRQTLVGHLVQPGDAFEVLPSQATVTEGKQVTISAKAGGAQKVYWTIDRAGTSSVVATDCFKFTLDAGRVSGDEAAVLRFKAVYPQGVKTLDIPITIKEGLADPEFTLEAPKTWDGRKAIEVVPRIANKQTIEPAGAGEVKVNWSLSGPAVSKTASAGKLVLTRSQASGTLTITATLSNGGAPVTRTVVISVQEPASDPWVARIPDADERPVDNQFFARDDKNEGTLCYRGTLKQPADSVFLKLYADGTLIQTERAKPAADGKYALLAKLKPGLIVYKTEFGISNAQQEAVLETASNLVCGDAYLIDGQSNSVSTDWGEDGAEYSSPWIRSFGSMDGDLSKGWGNAVRREGEQWQIGYWAMDLAKQIVENHKIPVCILNGAVGGTRIDQHIPNAANPTDNATIYGRLLARVRQARLTHGIRAVLWHQGEADQSADGPDGGYGCETYENYFHELAAAWKQHMPNIQHYYLFQIWPNACSQGGTHNSDKLRNVQRLLPRRFAHMSVMSTLGIRPEGGCHYPAAGYARMAQLIAPLIEQNHYGKSFFVPITAPDLKRATYTSAKKDEIVLEFGQPMAWNEKAVSQFHLDGKPGQVVSGATDGNRITLKLKAGAEAKTLTYVVDRQWDPEALVYGINGIAALTFCDCPIEPHQP